MCFKGKTRIAWRKKVRFCFDSSPFFAKIKFTFAKGLQNSDRSFPAELSSILAKNRV